MRKIQELFCIRLWKMALLTLVACPLALSNARPVESHGKPNIIVIYADDHAQHAIGSYGSRVNTTPNIDRLASDGMRFTQSFVANSICSPSRATLLTGLHSHSNGQLDNKAGFKDDLPTFAKCLQDSGYDTAVIGKWHLPTTPNGFNYWAISKGGFYNASLHMVNGVQHTHGHVTDVITKHALDWVANRDDQSNPFLVWISHSAAHRTWSPAIRHLGNYDDAKIPEPETLFDNYDGRNSCAATAQMRISKDLFPAYDLKLPITGRGILDDNAKAQLSRMSEDQLSAWRTAYGPKNREFADSDLEGVELTRWKYQRYIKDYLRCLDGLDESVGTIRRFLQSHGLANNTVVIYTSDQGFFLGEHGWYDKRWMYEESLRTPLIVFWPGITQPGSTSKAMVQNIDIAPTLLAIAGVQVTHNMDGESLVPLLKSQSPTNWRKAIYYHYQMEEPLERTSHLVAKHYGIRTERFKLIYFYGLDQWELYNLDLDPIEMQNLALDFKYQQTMSELQVQLRDLRLSYGDSTGRDFWVR